MKCTAHSPTRPIAGVSRTLWIFIPLVAVLSAALVACSGIASGPVSGVSDTVPQRITVAEIQARQKAGEKIIFVDAREQTAWEAARIQIPGSIRVPPDQVSQHLQEIPRDGVIVTYCT